MFEPKLIKTQNLNQVAFLTTLGGNLIEIQKQYPNNVFVVSARPWMIWYEKHLGMVPYRKYCNQRIRIKEKSRKQSGLPKNFTGRVEGFEFGDLARVRPYTKKELEKI